MYRQPKYYAPYVIDLDTSLELIRRGSVKALHTTKPKSYIGNELLAKKQQADLSIPFVYNRGQ